MGYFFKMISFVIVSLSILGSIQCHPQRFPEVNNLKRSIDTKASQSNDFEETIKEVENIIKNDPKLPRLTRGEILDILDNITKVDNPRDPKSLMVVMPYTPTGSNMEELFTKPPVTQIIGAPLTANEEGNEKKTTRRRPSIKFNELPTTAIEIQVTTSRSTRRRRPEATTEISTTSKPSRSRRPTRRRTTTTTTSVDKHPNHRYPGEEATTSSNYFVQNSGIRIIDAPNLVSPFQINQDLSTDLYQAENVRQEVVVKQPSEFKPTLMEDINLPDNLKTVYKDLYLETALNKTQNPEEEERNKIKELLASVGVVDIPSTTTTTTTAIPNAESVADSLTPDMRDLLKNFGLLPDDNPKPSTPPEKFYPDQAEVKAESYNGFKPLPDDASSRGDMDALLAQFGLGRSARKQKAVKKKPDDFDVVPNNMRDVLTDLGLTNREARKIRTPPAKQHVFNPDSQYATADELRKLEKLMNVIKQLERLNGTATEEDLKKIDLEEIRELVGSLNNASEPVSLDEMEGPDPTKFDDSIVKNEVKRQETTTVSTTTSTEQERSPSISDLEASFGGQVDSSTEVLPDTTTEGKRTGFYYLVDWNTFLDIDDTKGRRVNLRFQPKVGDPKRFLSVSVP